METASRTYLAIDLKSFYASVECVERGLDPMTTRLVVADESRTEGTICLAVSPALKAYGIPGRPRLFEVTRKINELKRHRPDLPLDYIVAKPRMAFYITYSTRIYSIYLRHVAPEDIHAYSIDEVFIDVTDYLASTKMTAREMAQRMIREVLQETGITATAGIGSNLYLAKVAMDIVAKHIPADKDGVRIASLDEESYRRKLWNHRPLEDFWRVGHGIARRLENTGIHTMGQIARLSLTHEDWFYKEFGVNAELLIDHAWGWEPCTIADIKAYKPETHSIGCGQVLPCPYETGKARIVVQEMAEGLALDLVKNKCVTSGITLTVGYDRENLTRPDVASKYQGEVSTDYYGRKVPKSSHGTKRLNVPTSSGTIIGEAVKSLFDHIIHKNLLIRRLNVTAIHVIPENSVSQTTDTPIQLDLFTDYDRIKQTQEKLKQEHRIQEALLNIKQKYGKNAILKGISYAEGSTARERNQQIGGHHE